MFVKNGWYLAAWSEEVSRTLFQRWIAGEPVLLYRRRDGEAVALGDRCPHRKYPLSRGRLVGDDVECGYHGYTIGSDGVCIGVREQEDKPRASTRRFELLERDGALWIWMGDAEPDPARLPDTSWLTGAGWTTVHGMLPLKARAGLLVENLLDLSHETFLHATSIGNAEVAATPVTSRPEGDVVYCSRRMSDVPAPPFYETTCGLGSRIDRWQDGEFHAPGVYILSIRIAKTGSPEPQGCHMKVLYGVTPATADTTHDFFALGRDFRRDDDELTTFMLEQQVSIMREDVDALEVQEIMYATDTGGAVESSIRSDLPALQARRLLARLLAKESSGSRPAAAKPRVPLGAST